jgi:hypothetical protein
LEIVKSSLRERIDEADGGGISSMDSISQEDEADDAA